MGGHLILNDWFELLQALLNLKANSLSVCILIYKLDIHCLPTGEKQLIIWKPLLHANHIQLNTHSSFNIISDMLCPYVLYQQQKCHLTLSSEITSRSCSNTMQSFLFMHVQCKFSFFIKLHRKIENSFHCIRIVESIIAGNTKVSRASCATSVATEQSISISWVGFIYQFLCDL